MATMLRSRRVFSGALLKVDVQKHEFPGGYVGRLEIITHPGAVLIVPFLTKEKIVLIRQYRPVVKRYLWELPAGTLEAHEGLLACARRELREEAGYCASRWEKIGSIFPAPGYTTEKITIFKAEGLGFVGRINEEDEVISVQVFSVRQILQLFKEGGILDAKTICALTLAGAIT